MPVTMYILDYMYLTKAIHVPGLHGAAGGDVPQAQPALSVTQLGVPG